MAQKKLKAKFGCRRYKYECWGMNQKMIRYAQHFYMSFYCLLFADSQHFDQSAIFIRKTQYYPLF